MEYQTTSITLFEPRQTWPSKIYGEVFKIHPDGPIYVLGCPVCGKPAFLVDHNIQIKDGKVTLNPSVVCPHCPAHYWVKDGKIV